MPESEVTESVRRQHGREREKRLKLKELKLPTSGEFPFEPSKNWFPSQPLPKGDQKGYLDKWGNEWVKGRAPRGSLKKGQGFEWDVQLSNGKHKNIDWDGNISHPK